MASKFESLNALIIDISSSSGEVLSVGSIQQTTRTDVTRRTAFNPSSPEVIGRNATIPNPPLIIDQPATVEEKKEGTPSYCEMLESGEAKLDSHFPQGNKPFMFEERLLFVIKQIIIGDRLGDVEILKTAFKAEFSKEVGEDDTILGDFKAAFDDTLPKLYMDSSLIHLLKKK